MKKLGSYIVMSHCTGFCFDSMGSGMWREHMAAHLQRVCLSGPPIDAAEEG